MFQYSTQPASRRLSALDRPASDRHPRSHSTSGSSGIGHARSVSDFSFASFPATDDAPMDEAPRSHQRHRSEPAALPSARSSLDVQLAEASDHLLALLQREASDYSSPLPTAYYPGEFDPDDDSKKATVGPWRKRIASWMCDVVDHFRYDRNVVAIALRYIDRYIGHLLGEHARGHRRADSGIGSSRGANSANDPPVKRRHFQLVAVTSLYLAIKVHGELMEDDPVSGAEYCAVASLVHEVDGRAFLGAPKEEEEETEEPSSDESEDDLKAVHHELADLKRRQRRGRWTVKGLGPFPTLPFAGAPHREFRHSASLPVPRASRAQPPAPHSALPYKPRKRGMLSGPLRLHSFVELSRGLFTARDITTTEKKILKALNYAVNPPTSRRAAGELLRMLALSYCASVDAQSLDTAATAAAAERVLGLDRTEILGNVLKSACAQIEGAAGVPALSIGCAPSVVAYAAVLNAVDEEFDRAAVAAYSDGDGMEVEGEGQPGLADFQRHYRRCSHNNVSASVAGSSGASDRDLFLEAWREQFLVGVYDATHGALDPDAADLLPVRELLMDLVTESKEGSPASPTETTAKRAPRSPSRSPRSVATGSPSRSSLVSRASLCRVGAAKATLLSPYDAHGRATSTSTVDARAPSFGGVPPSAGVARRSFYKQTSEPLPEARASIGRSGGRSKTPDFASRGTMSECQNAFRPPHPNPLFFSA
ncbi:hypothetical protein ACHAXT_013046 [Thalassiosira profunda]